MRVAALVAAALLASATFVVIVAPVVAARVDNRPMTKLEREQITWAGLAVFLALFTAAAIAIEMYR